jgi:hypothetical protein
MSANASIPTSFQDVPKNPRSIKVFNHILFFFNSFDLSNQSIAETSIFPNTCTDISQRFRRLLKSKGDLDDRRLPLFPNFPQTVRVIQNLACARYHYHGAPL